MAQEAISYLLAEKAREGKLVARLKWGDPFVFDRGGEEALFLHEQRRAVRGRAGHSRRHRRAGVRGRAGDLSGRRRHDHAGSRLRGREPHAARRSTGRASRGSTAPSSATPARSSCRASSRRCIASGWPADGQAVVIYNGTLPTQETVVRHARGAARHATRWIRADGPADAGRRPRGRAPRAPALVRRAAAVRTPRAGDAAARPGGGAGRSADRARRRGHRGADDPHHCRPTIREPLLRGCGRSRRVRLDRLHERQCASKRS